MESICERNCSKCTFIERCGGCSVCEASVCSKNCGRCFALCHRRPGAVTYFNKVLDGPAFELKPNLDEPISYHIPIIPDPLKVQMCNLKYVGIHAQQAFARNGEKINKSYLEKGFAGVLNINEDAKGILECYVKDRTLEGFWDKRKDIYNQLKQLKLAAAIAPNFSVYEDAPRLDHMHNIKRSVIMYNELLDSGINAIPDVSWFNVSDLDYWCKEIVNKSIPIIAFSFQVVDIQLKTSNEWCNSIPGFRYLCQNIPQNTKIIIAGLVSPLRVMDVINASQGQSVHILNQSAYVQGRRGVISSDRSKVTDLHYCDVLKINIDYFDKLYKRMNLDNENNGLMASLNKWDAAKVRAFCLEYIHGNFKGIEEQYGISLTDAEMVYSMVKRRIRRKPLMEEGDDSKCQNQDQVIV